jgi:hypothetical protein
MSAGGGPSPDVDGAVALQDSVVAEQMGQSHIGAQDD